MARCATSSSASLRFLRATSADSCDSDASAMNIGIRCPAACSAPSASAPSARSFASSMIWKPTSELVEPSSRDRKSVVSGKRVSVRVDLGGRRIIKKKKQKKAHNLYLTYHRQKT